MSDQFDPFKPESGLKGDYIGSIVDAYFEPTQYGTVLQLKKLDVETNEEVTDRYGCGPDWATYDGGASIHHPSGVTKGFNGATAMSELIVASFKAGAEDVMRARSAQLYQNRGPMYAAFWKGLQFHWDVISEQKSFKDRETGEQKSQMVNRILPSKFIGEVPVDNVRPVTGTPQAQAQPVGTTPANPVPADGGPFSGVNPADQTTITNLAKTHPQPQFVDEVMSLNDSTTGQPLVHNANLIAALADPAFYESLKAS